MNSENNEENYPIAVLIEELRNEDTRSRLNSIKNLTTIAVALGPEKTRTQLIPFLTDSIYDEEDVLYSLTDQFINLIDYVGGQKWVSVLLQPLETFAALEEETIRDKSVQVLRKISFYHTQKDIVENFFPLVQRYAHSQWFGTKCSAVALFPVVYPRVDIKMKERIIEMITKIVNEDTPMVRKAVAHRLGELAVVMLGKIELDEMVPDLPMHFEFMQDQTKDDLANLIKPLDFNFELEQVKTCIIPLIEKLWSENQEPVRLAVLQSVVQIATALGPVEIEKVPAIKKIVTEAVHDTSWRIRCIAADLFPTILKAFNSELKTELVSLFTTLLRDEETEVRLISLNKSKSVAYHLAGREEEAPETSKGVSSPQNFRNDTNSTLGQNGKLLMNSDSNENDGYFTSSSNSSNANNPTDPASGQVSLDGRGEILKRKFELINSFVNFDSISFGDVDYLIFRVDPFENAVALKEYKRKVLETKDSRTINADADGQTVLLKTDFSSDDSYIPEENNGAMTPNSDNQKPEAEIDLNEGQKLITKILIPNLLELSNDGTIVIRISLANSIMGILPLLPKESIQNDLLTAILNQLSDSNSDVRLNLISRFDYLKDVIGTERFFKNLIPAIENLSSDKKWRIRLGVMNYILLLAERFGTKVFTESMLTISINFLIDSSYAIRLASVTTLTKLGIIFGSKWTHNLLIPAIIKSLSREKNYLYRMICLEAIISFIEVIELDQDSINSLLDQVITFSSDSIPNVRFKAAQTLSRLGKKSPESVIQAKILPRLREMASTDGDSDVIYFSAEAIHEIDAKVHEDVPEMSETKPFEPMECTS